MDLNSIKNQLESVKAVTETAKQQQRSFETLLTATLKGAPEKDKEKISKIQALSVRALSLAKNGKLAEAQELIKDFK